MTTLIRRLILFLFALWCVFPIYWLLNTSLKTARDAIARPPRFIFTPIFDNYQKVLQESDLWAFFLNSTIVGLGSTAATLAVGIPAAYVLARFPFRGSADVGFWILTTRMTPPVAMLIPFFVMYHQLGLLDTHIGVIIVHAGLNLSIVVWILRGFFQDVPRELEEAAYIDGCTYWGAFTRVILPIARPGIAAAGILTFLFSWNEFLFALVLADSNVRTVPVGLYGFVGYQQIRWGELSASAMIMLVPVLLFVLFFQRSLIRGLTFGAVKG
ncbi:MAG: carbohydrate ABC transporter permease [Geminicoccaceae bacterium]